MIIFIGLCLTTTYSEVVSLFVTLHIYTHVAAIMDLAKGLLACSIILAALSRVFCGVSKSWALNATLD